MKCRDAGGLVWEHFPSPSGQAQSAGGQVTKEANPPWLLLSLHLASWTTENSPDLVAALVLRLPQVGAGGTEGVLVMGGKQGIAYPVSACARKVAIAQLVGKQETNCVGERERERKEKG